MYLDRVSGPPVTSPVKGMGSVGRMKINKDETPVKVKTNEVKDMFNAKKISIEKVEIDRLVKEERLDKKKRLQQG